MFASTCTPQLQPSVWVGTLAVTASSRTAVSPWSVREYSLRSNATPSEGLCKFMESQWKTASSSGAFAQAFADWPCTRPSGTGVKGQRSYVGRRPITIIYICRWNIDSRELVESSTRTCLGLGSGGLGEERGGGRYRALKQGNDSPRKCATNPLTLRVVGPNNASNVGPLVMNRV